MGQKNSVKKTTISDVAKLAKTGKTSISRYFNGEHNVLSANIKARIEDAIKKLNYHPNQMARSLKKGRTKLIAFILPDIINPYSVEVMQGLEATCQKHGYTLLVCNTNKDKEREKYYLQLLISYNVEGAVIHASHNNGHLLTKYPFPLVLVDRKIKKIKADLVGLDNIQASTVAASYLIESGFEAILFLTEEINQISTRLDRINTFKKIIKKNKNTICDVVEITADTGIFLEKEIDKQIDHFCKKYRGMRKTIVAINGSMTLHAALSMKRLNLTWGKDIGFLGFDDPQWAAVAGEGITTIRQPTYEIGSAAFKLLLDRIEGNKDKTKELLFSGELIIRNSTK